MANIFGSYKHSIVVNKLLKKICFMFKVHKKTYMSTVFFQKNTTVLSNAYLKKRTQIKNLYRILSNQRRPHLEGAI